MDERFLYDLRTGCGNSTKFARIFDMGFIWKKISAEVPTLKAIDQLLCVRYRYLS